MATQSSGSDGLTAGAEGSDAADGDNGAEGEGAGGQGQWGLGVERGVWDEPIIKRWEDAKVRLHACFFFFFVPQFHNCHAVSCHAVSCHTVSCHAVSCHTIHEVASASFTRWAWQPTAPIFCHAVSALRSWYDGNSDFGGVGLIPW